MTQPTRIVIATRGSALALWQAEHTKARLIAVAPGLEVVLNVIKTSGDRIQDVPLSQGGGKGLFVKEIEQALVEGSARQRRQRQPGARPSPPRDAVVRQAPYRARDSSRRVFENRQTYRALNDNDSHSTPSANH